MIFSETLSDGPDHIRIWFPWQLTHRPIAHIMGGISWPLYHPLFALVHILRTLEEYDMRKTTFIFDLVGKGEIRFCRDAAHMDRSMAPGNAGYDLIY